MDEGKGIHLREGQSPPPPPSFPAFSGCCRRGVKEVRQGLESYKQGTRGIPMKGKSVRLKFNALQLMQALFHSFLQMSSVLVLDLHSSFIQSFSSFPLDSAII